MTAKKHVLITGASGFIGSYLSGFYLKKGYDVTGISRTRPRNPDIRWVEADLSGPFLMPEADMIVHAAAETREPENEKASWKNNVQASQNLIHAALQKKIRKIIFLSSVSVYGCVDADIVDEDTPILEPGAYGRTKYRAEKIFGEHSSDLSSAVLRLPAVAGRGSKNIWLAGVLQNMIERRAVSLYNPDSLFNNLVHVSDLAAFIETLFEKKWEGSETMALASRQAISVREAVALIAVKTGYDGRCEERAGERKSFHLSFEKARRFGYDPMTVSEAIERFVDENKKASNGVFS